MTGGLLIVTAVEAERAAVLRGLGHAPALVIAAASDRRPQPPAPPVAGPMAASRRLSPRASQGASMRRRSVRLSSPTASSPPTSERRRRTASCRSRSSASVCRRTRLRLTHCQKPYARTAAGRRRTRAHRVDRDRNRRRRRRTDETSSERGCRGDGGFGVASAAAEFSLPVAGIAGHLDVVARAIDRLGGSTKPRRLTEAATILGTAWRTIGAG